MKLMMLDGNSIMNRAFYGIRLFSNREGLYTNAVYGFINILLKLIDEEEPNGICVAFDVDAPTKRSEVFGEYKAHRKRMPDELAVQMPVIRDVLEAMNIPCYELAGYEADDVLGTICKKLTDAGENGIVVTGDKDSLQLLNEFVSVRLITTSMGQTVTTIYTPEVFREEYGFEPIKLIDHKALMGDPSDNIPGVKGIGKKTASSLIQSYGGINEVYNNIDDLGLRKGVAEKLIDGKEMAFLSYELAKIDTEVPIEIDYASVVNKPADTDKLYNLFIKLEFKTFLDRLGIEAAPADDTVTSEIHDFEVKHVTQSNWRDTLETIEGAVAVVCQQDVAAIAFYHKKIVYLGRECEFEPAQWIEFLNYFFSEAIPKYGLDIKTDMRRLLELNVKAEGYVFDPALCAYILNPSDGRYTIERLSLSFLETQIPSPKAYEDRSAFESLSLDNEAETSIALHTSAVYFLSLKLMKMLEETDMVDLYYKLELPLCSVLADMEHTGMKVDADKLTDFSEWLSERVDAISQAIYLHAGKEFNINSTKMLGEVLFEELGLPPVKKTKTGYSTDIGVLEKLKGKHPIIEEIIEYRQLTKLKSTYADGLLNMIAQDGRIHTRFNMMVTATGRLSSTDPNLQNIPIRQDLGSEIRKMFVAEDGCVFVDADYSQIELRVLAHIADDKAMQDAFINGDDIHTITASQVFGVDVSDVTPELRYRAKAVNFGIVYGISDFSLAEDIGVTRAEAAKYIESYLNHYSGIREYMKQIVETAKSHTYVKTIMNRQRFIPELSSRNYNIRSFGERAALNTPIQGSAADIIKKAMLQVSSRLKKEGLKSKLILQVHDELLVEAPEDEAEKVALLLAEEMENVIELKVPLTVDTKIGKTWFDTM